MQDGVGIGHTRNPLSPPLKGNIMKTLAILPILLIASAASAGEPGFVQGLPTGLPSQFQLPSNGSCSSADGSIEFDAFQYQGGALMQGQLTSSRELTVDGAVWASSEFYAPGGNKTSSNNFDSVVVTVTDGVSLFSDGSQIAGSTVYAAMVTVESLVADVAPKTAYVLCENSWLVAP